MFDLLFKAGKFIIDAAIVYAASDEGRERLTAILDEAEAEGIDIPFYEPSDSEPEGEQVAVSKREASADVSQVSKRDAAYYLRHPDQREG